MERVEAGKSHIGPGVGNHPLEIYAALSAAFMPIASAFSQKMLRTNNIITKYSNHAFSQVSVCLIS